MRRVIPRAVLTFIAAGLSAGCAARPPAPSTPPPAPVVIEGFGGGDPLLLGELPVSPR